jgi:hypothetical protein
MPLSKEKKKEWYQKNRDRLNKQKREYYAQHKEKWHGYYQTYYPAHRPEILARTKEYYEKYGRAYYQKTKDVHYARSQTHKRKLKEWFASLKIGKYCIKCGEDNPKCLDYHHRDPEAKVAKLADMVSWGVSRERIIVEIGKCVLLCANCHRKL